MTAVVVDGMRGKEYRLPTDLRAMKRRRVSEERASGALFADIPFGLPDEQTAQSWKALGPHGPSPWTGTASTRGASYSLTGNYWPMGEF